VLTVDCVCDIVHVSVVVLNFQVLVTKKVRYAVVLAVLTADAYTVVKWH